MRKTNLNLKRVKFCKKIAYFCVVQIIILALFSNIMYILSQTRNRLQTPYEATIKVDDVEYESYAGSNWCYVFSNSQRYIFTLAYEHSDNGYSNYELYKTLNREDLRIKKLENQTDGDKVYIARNVDGDYEVGEDCYGMTCEDLDYYWYDDSKFLDE